jgi:hypothetical protein
MAKPATQNLTLVRGDTETVIVNMTSDGSTPINVAGRTYRAQIRQTKESAAVSAAFTCTVTNAAAGQITCVLSANDSSSLIAGANFWDLEETNGSVVTTILAGAVNVLADVTR